MHEQTLTADWLGTSQTAREIIQQPAVWSKLGAIADHARSFVTNWLGSVADEHGSRIVLCGAGTSAYIGDVLAPYLRKELDLDVVAVCTTDIVSAPLEFLLPRVRTLMISFGRSGDSPESMAAINLANQVLSDCSHLIVTCNPDGQLAAVGLNAKCCSILLPPETLDKSFAMTSSFTSMLLAVANLMVPDEHALQSAAALAMTLIQQARPDIEAVIEHSPERIAFLGSGPFYGIAREAALKMIELTAGGIDCYAETSLGFRHGPKSIVSAKSINILLPSNCSYTRQYDDDLWLELVSDNVAAMNIRLDKVAGLQSFQAKLSELPSPMAGAVYIVFCQMLALKASLARCISPDNPCPGGQVNRVVRGVTIHVLKVTS